MQKEEPNKRLLRTRYRAPQSRAVGPGTDAGPRKEAGVIKMGTCYPRANDIRRAIATVCFCAIGGATLGAAGQVPTGSFFHTEGRHIVSDTTGERCVFRGVNIQGLEFGSHGANPYPGVLGINYFQPTPGDISMLATQGFNVVRIPFEWARLTPGHTPGDPVVLNSDYLSLLDQVVGWAYDVDMYVILEMHDYLKYWAEPGTLHWVSESPEHQSLLTNTWRLIAQHYETNTAVLGYDMMNEPVRDHDSNWHTIAQATLAAIRSVDTNHLVFVNGRNYSLPMIWERDNGVAAFVADSVIPPRVVYTPHIYYGAGGTANTYPEGGSPTNDWQYYIRDRLLNVLNWGASNDVPIFVAESGVPNTEAWAEVLAYVFTNYYNPLHVSHAYWAWLEESRASDDTNRLVRGGYQMQVLVSNLGGTYTGDGEFALPTFHSPAFRSGVVEPWIDLSWTSPVDDIGIAIDPNTGEWGKSIAFGDSYSGIKFYHEYLDVDRYAYLEFQINGQASGGQDFWIFVEDGDGTELPKKLLSDYFVPTTTPEIVRVPIEDLLTPGTRGISSVTLQNMGSAQPRFFLFDVGFLSPKTAATFANIAAQAEELSLSLTGLTPGYDYDLQKISDLLQTNWTAVFSFTATGTTTNFTGLNTGGATKMFYRTK